MPHRSATLRRAQAAVRVRWQLRRLRRALRAGNKLDAVAAAGRIHAIAVRPNLAAGRWPQAQAACERVLSHIPARQAPGYLPGLRGVIECLHADAARAAREAGDLRPAKLHLIALIGYLRDRRAPLGRQVVVLVDLALVYIAANEARTGQRILADIGSFLAGEYPGDRPRPKRLAGRPRRTVAISPPPRCALARQPYTRKALMFDAEQGRRHRR
jgi:hypothetical protein